MTDRPRNNFDACVEIDAERIDPRAPEAASATLSLVCPATSAGTPYPRTCCVNFSRGRWPEWVKPLLRHLRRLQGPRDPDYGFLSAGFTALPLTALVSRPDYDRYVFDLVLREAAKAGWTVTEEPDYNGSTGQRHLSAPPAAEASALSDGTLTYVTVIYPNGERHDLSGAIEPPCSRDLAKEVVLEYRQAGLDVRDWRVEGREILIDVAWSDDEEAMGNY